MTKKLLVGFALVMLILVLIYRDLIAYGLAQAKGQWRVLYHARPIAEVLADPGFPDSLKARIELVQRIRRYAVDSLGINDSPNYTTVYDDGPRPILQNLTACQPFAMEPYTWRFPYLGQVPYKGFFDSTMLVRETQRVAAAGYETYVYPVGGWSTLGWFRDPILASMLRRSEGDLANLIIHELTHATLFIKDNVQYNENLATFVGDEGAKRFLAHHYGAESPEYRRYASSDEDRARYGQHILGGYRRLDSLYRSFPATMDVAEKQLHKETLIRRIVADLDTVPFLFPERYRRRQQSDWLPNNNYFMSYRHYRENQNQFAREFEEDFGGDFPAYLAYLKEKYPSL